MRITEQMMIKSFLSNIERTRDKMTETQQQLSSGKKINTLSDDPLNVHKALRLRQLKATNERFQVNVQDSINFLSSLTEEMTTISDIVSRVKDFGIQGSIPTADDEGRHALALQVDQMLQELVDQANTTFIGKSLFGGVQTIESPYEILRENISETFTIPDRANFQDSGNHRILLDNVGLARDSVLVTDATGATTFSEGADYTVDRDNGTLTILGSGAIPSGSQITVTYDTQGVGGVKERFPKDITGSINREIVEKTELTINVSGRDIFGSPAAPDKVDIFNIFRKLKNELQRNNTEGIQSTFDNLDAALAQVTAVATETGTELIRMTMLDDRLENENTTLAARLSSIEDVDVAQAAVEFQADQAALQAALAIGARIIQPSLISFLR
jgi:flagellar hook-associated protein 3 FlgL